MTNINNDLQSISVPAVRSTATLSSAGSASLEAHDVVTLSDHLLLRAWGGGGASAATSTQRPQRRSTLGHNVTDASGLVIVPNFGHVDNNFRGGRPTDAGIDYLQQHGVRSILDLENDPNAVAHERDRAKKDGLNFYSVPMSANHHPSDATLSQALGVLNNPANGPVYTHCYQGEDRTGLVEALERVHNGWTPAAAYDEMVNFGSGLLPHMVGTFRAKTGFTPPQQ
jgi:hypothetical protein